MEQLSSESSASTTEAPTGVRVWIPKDKFWYSKDPGLQLTFFFQGSCDGMELSGNAALTMNGDIAISGISLGELWVLGHRFQPPGTIDSRSLRSLSLDSIRRQLRGQLADFFERSKRWVLPRKEILNDGRLERWSEARKTLQATPQSARGRRPLPPEHFRQVATDYLRLCNEGHRDVLVRLARQHGKPKGTVTDWVHRATKLGYLSPGTRGRAGRAPGPNLHIEDG